MLNSSIKKLSVVIPTYNEASTIKKVIEDVINEVKSLNLDYEIIVIDDASEDRTADIVKSFSSAANIVYKKMEFNKGKGAAITEGFRIVTGDIAIIQDADLEYNPEDYRKLIDPILKNKADVVYGSRFRGEHQRALYFWHYMGNKLLTLFSNVFTNLNLSDMETGYKLFKKDVLESITPRLKSKRFGIEPEITARVAHEGWRIYEVPVNYYGRTYKEGKKINWWDGVKAFFAIIYFNVFDR